MVVTARRTVSISAELFGGKGLSGNIARSVAGCGDRTAEIFHLGRPLQKLARLGFSITTRFSSQLACYSGDELLITPTGGPRGQQQAQLPPTRLLARFAGDPTPTHHRSWSQTHPRRATAP